MKKSLLKRYILSQNSKENIGIKLFIHNPKEKNENFCKWASLIQQKSEENGNLTPTHYF